MKKTTEVLMMVCVMVFLAQGESQTQTRVRSEIPEEYTWNLTEFYPSDLAWRTAKAEVIKEMEKIDKFKGKLGSSAKTLYEFFKLDEKISLEISRLDSYAGKRFDLDTRQADALGLTEEMRQVGTAYSSKSSFVEPEILKIDKETIDKYIESEHGLQEYAFYLHDLQRRKEHMLSEKEEKIIAESGLIADVSSSTYSVFSNAELPFPEITLSDGEKVQLSQAAYTKYRALANRNDRELVFKEFFGALNAFKNTLGTQLSGGVNGDLFYTRARGYDTCLQRALDANNIPVTVYTALIDNVRNNLDTFHRFLGLKKRMLGVDSLKYSDAYAPVVKGVELEFTVDEADALVRKSLAPLGTDYVDVVKKGMMERWIDYYPTPGKKSGAYSSGGVYDMHPFILMNFNGQFDDVSTLAHELGHTMQSYLSNKNQPFATARYPIFTAEVASTFNEALLIRYQLGQIKDDDVRLSLLMDHLDGIRQTVFRQTQFAEFELKIHEMAEQGKALTGESLTKLYLDIVRDYYGHDKDVCYVDDLYGIEWAYIPHFYYNFYVYQYATSLTASTALVENVVAGEKGAAQKMLDFLSAGGSDYPIELLKKAGVDMTTADPFNKTMTYINRIMDEIETILDKKGI